eukprot:Awhi_evm2s15042
MPRTKVRGRCYRIPKGQGTCSSIGDSHTVTLDGVKHDWGNNDYVTIFQGCDLTILGDHRLTDMQREVPLIDGADGETISITLSMYQGLKLQYKNTLVSVILDDTNVPRVYSESIDGQPHEKVSYREKIHRFIFELPDGSVITVHKRGNTHNQVYLINVMVSIRYKELCRGVSSLIGICGNWNNDEVDDGYTVDNVSLEGPWNANAYRANLELPWSNFPANLEKLRCFHVDDRQVFVDSFPEPPAARKRAVDNTIRRNIE